MCSFVSLSNNAIGLIAILGRDLPVSCHHLGWGVNLFFVAGVVGGDLRGLRPAKAAPAKSLLDLVAARAGSVEVLLRVAFYLGGAALACLDLVAQISQPIGKLGLINSGCELLRIEEAALL